MTRRLKHAHRRTALSHTQSAKHHLKAAKEYAAAAANAAFVARATGCPKHRRHAEIAKWKVGANLRAATAHTGAARVNMAAAKKLR